MSLFTTKGCRHRQIAGAMLSVALPLIGSVLDSSGALANQPSPPISVQTAAIQPGFADLVAAVKPAVVNISTTEIIKAEAGFQSMPNEGAMGEMMRQFFGPNAEELFRERPRSAHALGSGFIIDPTGYIVTNNHVIADASEIEVTLEDGSVHPAHIVGRDTKTDLALLKIEVDRSLPYLAFGDSQNAHVGDWVIAVGNPFGLGGSVTAGIISANDRNINAGPYDDFVQIDAPINPGNSGGPLFDQAGRVIGIDTAIYSPSGGSVGIGFAIPSNVASRVVRDLRDHGQVARGWLGVQMQEITPTLATALGVAEKSGVLVDVVVPDSPASRADFMQGDVITAFNGQRVSTPRDLAFAVADTAAGRKVPVTVLRDGRLQSLDVTIETEKAPKVAAAPQPDKETEHVGLALAPLTDDRRRELGLGDAQGVLVARVEPGSPAEESGLRPGDVILRVGSKPITTPPEAVAEIHAAQIEKRRELSLLVLRDGTTSFQALDLGEG
jgi:serine protease Do